MRSFCVAGLTAVLLLQLCLPWKCRVLYNRRQGKFTSLREPVHCPQSTVHGRSISQIIKVATVDCGPWTVDCLEIHSHHLPLQMATINNPSSSHPQKFYTEGLTFDDVLLMPAYSEVLPRDVKIESKLTST